MILQNLISRYPVITIMGDPYIDISEINHNSKKITNNSLFVAVQGFRTDGHRFIDEAIKNGAKAVILDRNISPKKNITYVYVEDTNDALSYISTRFYDFPWKKMNLIGVTGTNGKTSTTYYIKHILEKHGIKTGIIGTIGGVINDENIKLSNTTPEPLIIQKMLFDMLANDMEACVMEVSSHALELNRVKYMDFDIGIFTNLSKDHLDYHKTMENYFNSKLKLFYKTKKFNIVNIDDKYGRVIIDKISSKNKILTYGIDNKADIYATDIKYSIDKVMYTLNFNEEKIVINLSVPGKFSVYNSLAAASCAISMGIGLDTIRDGLESVEGIKGRFEIVPIEKNYSVIIDFAHTPDGLENVLRVLREFAKGRIIVVFGAGGNRDKTKRPEMGYVVGTFADYAIITSDNPRHEVPMSIIEDIIVGVNNTNIEYKVIEDRKKAILYAIDIAKKNDIILLAGKGHETYTIIGDESYPFDERQIVLDYIKSK